MICRYCGHTMNNVGGIALDMMPPIISSSYECLYCGATGHRTFQEAYRADDPPAQDEWHWDEPPKVREYSPDVTYVEHGGVFTFSKPVKTFGSYDGKVIADVEGKIWLIREG